MPDPVTGRWKRPRPEHAECATQRAKDPLDEEDHLPQTSKKRATSATATLAETNPGHGILDELAERLGNFHESARALASCLQNHDVSRKTDQSMIEAANCTFHRSLGEASNDLERVTPRSRESLRIETPSEKPRSHPETLTGKLRFRFKTPSEKSVSQTPTDGTPVQPSPAEPLEQVVEVILASSLS